MKDSPEKELASLLNKIGLGDNKAIEIIYRHYQAALFAFIRLRVRDDAAAEEILNDTFMIAFSKHAQDNASSTFKTWLCGIAKMSVAHGCASRTLRWPEPPCTLMAMSSSVYPTPTGTC